MSVGKKPYKRRLPKHARYELMESVTAINHRHLSLTRLREATKDLHELLHVHPLLSDLTSLELTLSKYRRILEAFLGFYRTLEPQLVTAACDLGCAAMYSREIRVDWLLSDLQSLGVSSEYIVSLPTLAAGIEMQSRCQLAGCLYVIEGSSLGGSVVTRHLAQNQNLQGLDASKFFASYGDLTTSKWRRVTQFMETECPTPENCRQAVAVARRTFVTLDSWLHACCTV